MGRIAAERQIAAQRDPLTIIEVARLRRVSVETVRRWIRSGALVAERHGRGEYRIWREALERFARLSGREPTEES